MKLLQLLLLTLLQLFLEPLSLLQLWLLLLQLLPLRLLQQSPLQATLFLFFFFSLLTPFLFLFPPLLDGVTPDRPRHPFPSKRGLDFLVRSASVLRKHIAIGPVTDGDGVTHIPRLGRLGGSPLALGTRRLDPPR